MGYIRVSPSRYYLSDPHRARSKKRFPGIGVILGIGLGTILGSISRGFRSPRDMLWDSPYPILAIYAASRGYALYAYGVMGTS